LDLDDYRARYGDIRRLDLILAAEGDSTNRFKVSKQADVLMLFYLFSAEELGELIGRLGYDFDPSMIPATIDHYLARTTHGSTLSKVVHAWVLARRDRRASWQLLCDALDTDLTLNDAASTREGIHLGAMAASADILQRCFTGLEVRNSTLSLHPQLPEALSRLSCKLRFQDHTLDVTVSHREITVASHSGGGRPITVVIDGEPHELQPGGVLRATDR
jgi:trehalose/maltose hydrolase-like predicted phosphorylase